MNEQERKKAAAEFIRHWAGRGDEKQETQKFWIELLGSVCGAEAPTSFIEFERPVLVDNLKTGKPATKFIDGYIGATRVLIEQKSADVSLKKGELQSDGALLTPYQQARRYGGSLPLNEQPRWIVACNFQEFHIHDMNRPNDAPEVLLLKDLDKEFFRLGFLTDTGDENIKKEMEISLKAGELVGVLYDALLKQYKDPESAETLKHLNALCVRLVFCLYAEDAGVFGSSHTMFHDYLKAHEKTARAALIDLFRVLDQRPQERDEYMDDDLAAFPYVNGGLFADESVVIPRIDENIVDLILNRASADFNWSDISPTIFGAVFESTLNPETRRSGGMHYTSIENIHKVIDPLFLDALRSELGEIRAVSVEKTRLARLGAFQDKLASLRFLDPACGSGNFLTETYLSLRRLENEAIGLMHRDQIVMGQTDPIKVSIRQFYGIEINDFAVTVARTALWIAESQMMKETENVVQMDLDFLPLKTNANITEGNALRLDWESVVPKAELNYIMGNPPFVGHQWRTDSQIEDMDVVFGNSKSHGKLDYVTCWYRRAADYMQGTMIQCAFVSTNSITQGESVAILWNQLFEKRNLEIQYAHRTFRWDSEASLKAHVHCVIIGFSCYKSDSKKKLFDNGAVSLVDHINGYLIGASDLFIQSRGKPLSPNMPLMSKGSQPTDGGNLILSTNEKNELIKDYPSTERLIKRYMGSDEFINNRYRYCLWLKGVSPSEYRKIPSIMERLQRVTEIRSKSPTASVRHDANTPMLFTQIRQPDTDYLAVPEVSSQRRRYIPIGYMSPEVISSSKLYLIPNASIYMFGVMTSNVHMAWMRVVCGRLKSDYSYSPAVYNNFPWPSPTDKQKARIEQTAQGILDARALYPDASLADLYDETAMPPELRKAHQDNDRAVMAAYGFDVKTMTEASCVAELMKLYQKLTSGE